MMNILHLTTYLQGGAGRVVVDLAEESLLQGGGAQVFASKTEYPGYGNYAEHLERLSALDIEVHLIDSLFKRNEILNGKVVDSVTETLRINEFDLIHAHAATPARIAMAAVRRAGLNIPVLQTMQGWGTRKTLEQESEDVAILNQVNGVVAVSESSRDLLIQKGVREELIEVVLNGVAPLVVETISREDQHTLKRLALNGRSLIGCIGTLCERKNQIRLVLAIAELIRSGIRVSLVLVGEDELNGECQKIAEREGISEFVSVLGYRKNARGFLKLIDVFCLPTLAEGSPLTVMESFCDGTFVVASDIPEIEEMIVEGESGLLCSPVSPGSIAKALGRAMQLGSREKIRMRKNAYAYYLKNNSQRVMIDAYLDIYRRLV